MVYVVRMLISRVVCLLGILFLVYFLSKDASDTTDELLGNRYVRSDGLTQSDRADTTQRKVKNGQQGDRVT